MPVTITSSVSTPPNAPVLTGVSPTTGAAGTTITLTGQNFGPSQVSSLSDFVTLTDANGDTFGVAWQRRPRHNQLEQRFGQLCRAQRRRQRDGHDKRHRQQLRYCHAKPYG